MKKAKTKAKLRARFGSEKNNNLEQGDNQQVKTVFDGGMTEDDLFDDCPVCQAMKKAKQEGREPTVVELNEAMEKSKERGAIVGGEWFDRPESPIRM